MLLFHTGIGSDEHAVVQLGTLSAPGMGHRPDNRLCAGAIYELQDSARNEGLRQHIAETGEEFARCITYGQENVVDGLCVHETYLSTKF